MQRAIVVAIVVLAAACDEAPNNTELCRQVYEALCEKNDECGTYTYLNECVSHYREECRVMRLHDDVAEPTEEAAAACVAAIRAMGCEGVDGPNDLDPSELSECRFLREVPDGGGGDADGDVDADADADS